MSNALNHFLKTDLFNERGRMHDNLHDSYKAGCQILLNVISSECYIRPHRHLISNKKEYLFVLKELLPC